MPPKQKRRQKARKGSKPNSPPAQPQANSSTTHAQVRPLQAQAYAIPPASRRTVFQPLRIPAPGEPTVLTTTQMTGFLLSSGKSQQALEMLEKDMKALQDLPDEHRDKLEVVSMLATTYRARKVFDKALEYYERELGVRLKVQGELHEDTARTLYGLGATLVDLRLYNKALACFLRCWRIRDKVLGDMHPDTTRAAEDVWRGFKAVGRPEDGEWYYERAWAGRNRFVQQMLAPMGRREEVLGARCKEEKPGLGISTILWNCRFFFLFIPFFMILFYWIDSFKTYLA